MFIYKTRNVDMSSKFDIQWEQGEKGVYGQYFS